MKEDNFNDYDRDNPYTIRDDSAEPDFSSIDDESIEGAVTGGSDDDVTSTPVVEQAQSNDTEGNSGNDADAQDDGDDSSVQEPKDRSVDGGNEKERNDIGSDIIRGHINTIILRALYERDKYGYEIMSDIEHKSHGQYSLKQPTLYSALKRLENQGYIRAYWKTDEVSNGGRRKYFTLTESGREITEKNLAEWEYSRTIIDSLISDRAFDFSQPAPTPVDFTILRNSVSRVPVVRSDEEGRNERGEGEEAQTAQCDNTVVTENTAQAQQTADGQVNAQPNQIEQDAVQSTATYTEQVQNGTATVVTDSSVQQGDGNQSTAAQPLQQDTQATTVTQEQQPLQQVVQDTQYVAQQSPTAEPKATAQQVGTGDTAVAQSTTLTQEQAQAESRRIAHENYLRLISEPVRVQPTPQEDVVPGSERVNTDSLIYNNRPETERDYKNLIDGIFRRAVSNGSVQYTKVEPPKPKPVPEVQHVRLVDRGRADGVKVATSSGTDSNSTYASKTTYDKGKTLLKASSVVLAITLIEFVLCFVFLNQLNTTWVYPAVILGIGVVQFAIFGIMALQGYGKNCVRPTTSGYISSCIILAVIGILIVSTTSFLLNLNPTSAVDVIKKIVIPSITVLNLIVFAVCFKAFIK